jgi:NAD(P)-dependent dehydrogenase (short-subunit alcohol dehydrogenase family)
MEQELLDKFKVNAIGPIHLFNAFMPLLKNGSAKKAIAISTGMADAELVSKFELDISPSYAISKAALNMAVAKFDAQYRKEGVLFLAISPGLVETGKSATRKSPLRTRQDPYTATPFY